MAVQHTSFVLKVLSGINKGASVRLKTGSVVIGRSMNSDIILHDDHIADQHIQLLITPTTITLQPLVQPVFVDDQEVTVEGVTLQPDQRVRLGNVEFTVTDSNKAASQSEIKAGKAQRTAKTASVSPPTLSGAAVERSTHAAASQTRRKTGSRILYPLLGLGLLLLANLLFFGKHLGDWLQQWGLRGPPEQQAADLLAGLGRKDFKVMEGPDGSITLSGYTRTTHERNTLLARVREASIQARVQIWSMEDMAENASMVTRALGETGIKIEPGQAAGQLAIQGFVSKAADWQRIRNSILTDVGGVQTLEDSKLQSLDGFMASFMQFIEKKGLSSRLVVTTDGKAVIVKGELAQQEIEKLQTLRKEFMDAYGRDPPIILDVSDIKGRIRLAIRSVSVGKVPFLVSKDGKKYMEGSALGDGYFIKAIKPDHVILTNNGVDIPLYYGIEEGKK